MTDNTTGYTITFPTPDETLKKRVEALEARVQDLENEVAYLRGMQVYPSYPDYPVTPIYPWGTTVAPMPSFGQIGTGSTSGMPNENIIIH